MKAYTEHDKRQVILDLYIRYCYWSRSWQTELWMCLLHSTVLYSIFDYLKKTDYFRFYIYIYMSV